MVVFLLKFFLVALLVDVADVLGQVEATNFSEFVFIPASVFLHLQDSSLGASSIFSSMMVSCSLALPTFTTYLLLAPIIAYSTAIALSRSKILFLSTNLPKAALVWSMASMVLFMGITLEPPRNVLVFSAPKLEFMI